MSLQAYSQAQASTENPRQTEYRLLGQVTGRLIDAKDASHTQMVEALDWNRRVWLTLQTDLMSADNQLPDQLKAGLISLAIWVDRHSRLVMNGEATVDALIEVNRSIMDGLKA